MIHMHSGFGIAERRLIGLKPAHNLTRPEAAGRLVLDDFMQGIQGKDVISDVGRIPDQ
jgi:hypothetical protein